MAHYPVIFTLLFSLAWCNFAPDVPVFSWSGSSFLSGQNKQVTTQNLESQNIVEFIQSFWDPSVKDHKMKQYVTSIEHNVPEIVVLFLTSEMRSDEITRYSQELPHLKNLMKHEKSSIFAPFVNFSDSLELDELFAHVTPKNIFYFGKGAKPQFTIVNDIEKIQDDVFTNGLTDVLIVECDLHTADSMIKHVQKFVSKKTEKYVSVFTATNHHHVDLKFITNTDSPSKRAIFDGQEVYADSNDDDSRPVAYFVYFNGTFWALFFIILFCLFILYIGAFAMLGIQGPDRLPEPKKRKAGMKMH